MIYHNLGGRELDNLSDHVFISHSSSDFAIANEICQILERANVRCWIAPRDIMPGKEYAEEIQKAIKTSRAFLLLITKNSDSSHNVRNEIEIAVNCPTQKLGIVLNGYEMSGYLQYHFSRIQLLMLETPVVADSLNPLVKALSVPQSITFPAPTVQTTSCKHNLPAPVAMIGRQEELEEIVSTLGKETQHYMILGMTGIGKKTLANNVAHRLIESNFYDVIIWMNAQEGTLTLNSFFEQVALVFDDQYLNQLDSGDKEAAVFSLLKNYAVLFVINGLHEIKDDQILRYINRFTYDDAVLVTSDKNAYLFDNSKTITLKGLNREDVKELVQLEGKKIGLPNLDSIPERLIDELHRLSSGNPYVIKLSIGQMKAGIPFERVLLGLKQARGKVFDDVFAKSWAVLDDKEMDLLMCLSIFRGSASSEALQSVSEIEDWDFIDNISNLNDFALVENNGAILYEHIRYYVLPLTRFFANKQLDRSQKRDVFMNNFANYYLNYANERQKDFQALALEIENLRQMLDWLREKNPVDHFVATRTLYPFFRDMGYWEEAIENYRNALAANISNKDLELDIAFARCELVGIYIRRGNSEEIVIAESLMDESIGVFSKANDQVGLCAAFGRKARIAQRKGNYEAAKEYGKKALALAKDNNLKMRIADVSHELADTYVYFGDLEKAKEHYTRSLDLYTEFGNIVRTIGRYNDLGRLALLQGDLEAAEQQLMKAIDYATQYKKLDTLCKADLNIAEYYYLTNEFSKAKEYAKKGEELAEKLLADEELELAKRVLEKIKDDSPSS